jgi:hypothetical protein
MLVAFGFWEVYGAEYPIFPSRLKQEPRTLGLTLVITFISGANFFSVLMFWPTQAFNVYGHDPVGVGIRSLPIGFGIMGGACIVLWLLSVFRGHNKELMIASSVLMTAGQFTPTNKLIFAHTDTLQDAVPSLLQVPTICQNYGGFSCLRAWESAVSSSQPQSSQPSSAQMYAPERPYPHLTSTNRN